MKNSDKNELRSASCSCGKNLFETSAQPIARFVCHCEVCQEFTQGPYSDVTVYLAKDINMVDVSHTLFKRFKAPPNIRRGICNNCLKPSIELGIFNQLAFIPVSLYRNAGKLADPSMHIFYHRRQKDIEDHAPKYSGFIKSQAVVTSLLLRGLYNKIFD